MKKQFILFGLLVVSSSLQAQVTINATNFQPTLGTAFGLKSITSNVAPGSAGANVTWDFSSVTSGGTQNNNFADCNGNSDCTPYAGSSYYIGTASLNSKTFYINNSTGLQQNGQLANGVSSDYTNPQQILKFPMTFNTIFNDNYALSSTITGMTQNVTGTIKGTVDGYGTLKTPTGTYTSVLRLKSEMQQTIETITGSGTATANQTILNYTWYQPGIAHEIMTIISTTITPPGAGNTIAYFTTTAPTNGQTAINNINGGILALDIYPNPVNKSFKVSFDGQKVNKIIVRDILGKTILLEQMNVLSNKDGFFEVNATQWAKGIYLLEIITENGSYAKKITKE